MSRRVLLPSLVAVAVLGAAGAYAVAQASESGPGSPEVKNGSATYVAPTAGRDGSFTFTSRVSDDSGVREVKVLAWPASMKPAPTAKEMAAVESATCEPTGHGASKCRYTTKVTAAEAATTPAGSWHVAVLVTAKDGDTKFVPRAGAFTVGK
ncbi:DUF5707 domain-containing protein [Streptomyces sp. NPDC086787]|uniref:DUF5707 domain-containing protein n=1 Tax=Streptomyces sp. NPDC086787 TaxID=3365759 RepID=UPI0037FB3BF3